MSTAEGGPSVGELGEAAVLDAVLPLLPGSDRALVGPGDDCAVLAAPDGRYCVSTDVLVEGRHFRTEWSSGHDVGRRAAAQNLADVAAMGARPVALVVSLVVPPSTPLAWVTDLARGLAAGCEPVGAGVVGGDLSAGRSVVVAVTVHGDLEGRAPVLRSGARPGDVVVHAGTLGRSAAGLALLQAGAEVAAGGGDRAGRGAGRDGAAYEADRAAHGGGLLAGPAGRVAREALATFRAPCPALEAGPALADLGATAMMDVSDSLLRDAGRIAAASGVLLDLDDPAAPGAGTADQLAALQPVAEMVVDGAAQAGAARAVALARRWVLTGGEDHGMLATVPAGVIDALPAGSRVIGRVLAPGPTGPGVTVGGARPDLGQGWDHFDQPERPPGA